MVRYSRHALLFTERRWGEPVSGDWIIPELIPSESSDRPDGDFTGVYLPSLLLATEAAARAIEFPELERVPVQVGSQSRCVLNPRITLRRYRPEGADVTRVPGGAILLFQKADFYADDLPEGACCFWFHDGNRPRYLLCNEAFRSRVREADLKGLAFRLLGHAF